MSDRTYPADVQALVQKTITTYGRLDCAFNNAGIELLSNRCTNNPLRILTN